MAENEYLDSSTARRWQSVVQAIREECSIVEVADRVEECLFKTPVSISKHLYQTGLVKRGKSTEGYVDLYRRYRREWVAFIAKAKLNGCNWANLIDLPLQVA